MFELKVVLLAAFVLCNVISAVMSRARVERMKIIFEAEQEIGNSVNDIESSYPRLSPYLGTNLKRMPWNTDLQVNSFNWKNCGSSSDSLVIKGLTVTPDPLKLPGTVSVSFDVSIQNTFDAPLKLAVELKKHEAFIWMPIPCIDNLGSCTYDNICETLASYSCPQSFVENKIPCKCPFTQGHYTLPTTSFPVPFNAPSGEYNARVQLSSGSQAVNCIEMHFNVS